MRETEDAERRVSFAVQTVSLKRVGGPNISVMLVEVVQVRGVEMVPRAVISALGGVLVE